MKPVSADDLLPDELAALMHFYAEAGVSWLSEDGPIDRFAEADWPVAGAIARAPGQTDAARAAAAPRPRTAEVSATVGAASVVAVPDAEAVESAVSLAAAAETAEDLIASVEGFSGCNLKFSARHTVFAAGSTAARVVIVGGAPAAEDDREGKPFSGVAGRVLDRMLAGIGIDAADYLSVNSIPWRTPGDRAPTVREVEICAPFARRLIELVRPEAVLVLGNLAARIMSDEPKAGIHALRGRWFSIPVGVSRVRAFATFHPDELIGTPSSKRLAWQDLLRFRHELGGRDAVPPQDL